MRCLSVSTGLLELVNRTAQNGSRDIDENELPQKLAEVAAMLRDMRFRTTHYQRRLAENELTEAEKCEREHSFKALV